MSLRIVKSVIKDIQVARLQSSPDPSEIEIVKHGILTRKITNVYKEAVDILKAIVNNNLYSAYDSAGFTIHNIHASYYYSDYSFESALNDTVLLLSDNKPSEIIDLLKEFIKEKWNKTLCHSFTSYLGYHGIRNLLIKGGYKEPLNSWEDIRKIDDKSPYISYDMIDNDNVSRLWDACASSLFNIETTRYDRIAILPITNKIDEFLYNGYFALNKPINKFTCTYKNASYSCDYDNDQITMYPSISLLDSWTIDQYKKISGRDHIIIHDNIDNVEIKDVQTTLVSGKFKRPVATVDTSLAAVSTLQIMPQDISVFNIRQSTNEYIKTLNRTLKVKVTGDKEFLISEYKRGVLELYNEIKGSFPKLFPKFGILSKSNVDSKLSRSIVKELSPLHGLCLSAYVIKHSRYDGMFMNDTENDIFDIELIIDGLIENSMTIYHTLIPLEDTL